MLISLGDPAEVHLRVRGEVDLLVAAQLHDSVCCAASAHADRLVVVDLAEVTFLDSSGISALVQAQLALTGEGRRLVVRNATAMVSRVLDLTGAGDFLGLNEHERTPSTSPRAARDAVPVPM